MTRASESLPLLIDGADVVGESGVIERENPARLKEIVGSVSAASAAQVGMAVSAAAAAGKAWRRLDRTERGALIESAWSFSGDERETLAILLTRELGKTLADTRGELSFGLANIAYAIEHSAVLDGREERDAEGRFTFGTVPYGVVAAIIPWNAPLILASVKIGPALLAGNTVVVKPSPFAPLAVTTYLRQVAAQLPTGVLNVVNGDGEVGAALVGDPRIGKIAFTGSGSVAKSILRSSAENVTPSLLELGGNDAALVLEDVELTDAVMSKIVFGTMLTSGQVCMAIKRLFVHQSRYAEFVSRYREVADSVLVLGDPMDSGTTVGPLANRQQKDFVTRLVEGARSDGAEVQQIGHTSESGFDLAGGYFLQPTMVTGVRRDSPIVVTEQFGPTVPILTFESEQDAIDAANDSEFGLCGSVWTEDEERAFAIGEQLDVGTVFINTHNRSGMSRRASFGGVKQSGNGREFGIEGLLEFSQTRVISHLASTQQSGDVNAGRRYPVEVST